MEATRAVTSKVDPAKLDTKIFAWMNMNPTGGFNAPHLPSGHIGLGSITCGQPKVESGNSGMIEFLDPRSDLPNWRILQSKAFRLKRKIRPEAGEIVLFPSYSCTGSTRTKRAGERVTIAFNATLRRGAGAEVEAGEDDD